MRTRARLVRGLYFMRTKSPMPIAFAASAISSILWRFLLRERSAFRALIQKRACCVLKVGVRNVEVVSIESCRLASECL